MPTLESPPMNPQTVSVGRYSSPEESRRQMLSVRLTQDGRNASLILDLISDVVEHEDWTRLTDRDSKPLTFRKYVEMPYEQGGIGWQVDNLQKVILLTHDNARPGRENPETVGRIAAMRAKVTDLLNPAANTHGSNQLVGHDNVMSSTVTDTGFGNSPEYAIRRLKRDDPELAQRVIRGELSPHAAAIQAGFRRKTITVPVEVAAAARAIAKHFTSDERNEIARLITGHTPLCSDCYLKEHGGKL